MRLASLLHRGLFLQEVVQIPKKANIAGTGEVLGFTEPGDLVSNSATVNNTEYRLGMLVVLAVSSQDGVTVGWIKKIIIRGKEVFFYVISRKCIRNNLQYFESVGGRPNHAVIGFSELRSYKPLIPRGTENSFVFFLVGKLIDDES
jgi:hypothetical protein